MSGTLFVGTSGFSYREWKPEFYPADLKSKDFLSFYSRAFPSVEINNTFYRAPTPSLLDGWKVQTPADFRFTLKAPQKITHIRRLRDTDEEVGYFLNTARALDERLGCILFQLPPSLKADAELLEKFLAALPGDPFRFAMEFRHDSWSTDDIKALLGNCGVAWCAADTEDKPVTVVRTARSHVYLRLRGLNYTDEDLQRWAADARATLDDGLDAYVYFKHEDDPSGVRFGLRFRELVGA
ncbi:MAG: DUF72 domain-containing protein [Actinomycetota bacterium]